jgi:hypothetical protein
MRVLVKLAPFPLGLINEASREADLAVILKFFIEANSRTQEYAMGTRG